MTTQVLRDNQGNIHIGPGGGAPSGAKIDVDFHSTDVDGIALAALASPAIGSERAAIKLGDYVLAQDPSKNGTKNLSILNAAGVAVAVLADGSGYSASEQVKYSCGIPLIIAPSGSMGDNGVLTSGTANPLTYLKTFTWFPASALYNTGTTPPAASNSPAGWYYTVWTTTTAATVYANTWDGASAPSIPATLTPIVAKGPLTFTGPTTEALYAALPMAALSVCSDVIVEIDYAMTNNANAKSSKVRFTNLAGTVLSTATLTSFAFANGRTEMNGVGVADKQRATFERFTAAAFLRDYPALTSEVTSAAWAVAICAARADATDVIVIEQVQVFQIG